MDQEVERQVLGLINDLKENYKIPDIEELIIEDMNLQVLTEPIRRELEKLVHLQSLQFNRCSLKSLDNMPRLESIFRICLDHNQLSGKELGKLSLYQNMIAVSCIDNKFEQIDDIQQLALCPNLCQINLYKNPVSDLPAYRQELFDSMPSLIFLDNLPKGGDEIALNAEIKIKKPMTIIGDHEFSDDENAANKVMIT